MTIFPPQYDPVPWIVWGVVADAWALVVLQACPAALNILGAFSKAFRAGHNGSTVSEPRDASALDGI